MVGKCFDPYCPALNPFGDAVLDGILHHRLQNQAGNLRRVQFTGNTHAHLQAFGKAHLLNVQVLQRKLQFFAEWNLWPVGVFYYSSQKIA